MARALTWDHRVDVESLVVGTLFRGLGAVQYGEGFFAPARVKTPLLAPALECIVGILKDFIRPDASGRSAFRAKASRLADLDMDESNFDGSPELWHEVRHAQGDDSGQEGRSCGIQPGSR
jgi:hypothetical protein